jgi:hypothetical protein
LNENGEGKGKQILQRLRIPATRQRMPPDSNVGNGRSAGG